MAPRRDETPFPSILRITTGRVLLLLLGYLRYIDPRHVVIFMAGHLSRHSLQRWRVLTAQRRMEAESPQQQFQTAAAGYVVQISNTMEVTAERLDLFRPPASSSPPGVSPANNSHSLIQPRPSPTKGYCLLRKSTYAACRPVSAATLAASVVSRDTRVAKVDSFCPCFLPSRLQRARTSS